MRPWESRPRLPGAPRTADNGCGEMLEAEGCGQRSLLGSGGRGMLGVRNRPQEGRLFC